MREIIEKYQFYPSKRLGQNFLTNKGVIKKIVEAAELKKTDIVLEIGPGLGALTKELAKKAKKVIAVEKDRRIAEILKDLLSSLNIKNVKFLEQDALKLKPEDYDLKPKQYKIIANLPFYLTSAFIRKFLEDKTPPKTMVLIIQKEVAQRICAKTPDMNLLAVSVQFYAKPKIISHVSKNSFWPAPKVDAAIIEIAPCFKNKKLNIDLFFKIVKAGFSQPRKQLINNLSKGLKLKKEKVESWLLKNNIQPEQRAETLSVDHWINLTKSCKINK